MGEVVNGVLASGTVGGLVLCTSVGFAIIASCFSDRVARRAATVLRALRSGK